MTEGKSITGTVSDMCKASEMSLVSRAGERGSEASREVEHGQMVKGPAERFEPSLTGSKQGKLNPEMQLVDTG